MTQMVCASVNRALEAYHDGELPVEQQIVVQTHLAECCVCAAEAKSLRMVRDALRATADVTSSDSAVFGGARFLGAGSLGVEASLASMSAEVISRVKAERHESWPARIGRMFEDLHLVWAGLAASSATVICAAIVAGVLYFAPAERGDSLAGVMSALAAPGSDRNPMVLDDQIKLPRFELQPTMPTMPALKGDDPDVALVSGVVTQDGRVAFPSMLSSPYSTADDRRLITAVSGARFEPAMTRDGAPVAVNFVWLLERTTVRAKAS